MAIPEGYRLLTVEDIGKVFGRDLEPNIFIDSSATLTNSIITASFVALDNSNVDLDSSNDLIVGAYIEDGFGYQIGFSYGTQYPTYFVHEGEFDEDIVAEINTISDINGTITAVGYSNDDNWNNWLYVKDKSDPKTQFITDMDGLAESIVNKAGSSGKKTIKEMKSLVDGLKTEFVTQEKTVTPTKSTQTITPDSGKDGLSKVTVNAIPNEYIVPSGTLNITENGTHDVTSKASVVVNVPGESLEEYDGSWEIADGFTAIFAETYGTPPDYLSLYSLDNGLTWDHAGSFAYNRVEMEGVVQIKFKVVYQFVEGYEMYDGGRVVCEELGVDIEATSSNSEIITDNFILTQNINVSMGSAD